MAEGRGRWCGGMGKVWVTPGVQRRAMCIWGWRRCHWERRSRERSWCLGGVEDVGGSTLAKEQLIGGVGVRAGREERAGREGGGRG